MGSPAVAVVSDLTSLVLWWKQRYITRTVRRDDTIAVTGTVIATDIPAVTKADNPIIE